MSCAGSGEGWGKMGGREREGEEEPAQQENATFSLNAMCESFHALNHHTLLDMDI